MERTDGSGLLSALEACATGAEATGAGGVWNGCEFSIATAVVLGNAAFSWLSAISVALPSPTD